MPAPPKMRFFDILDGGRVRTAGVSVQPVQYEGIPKVPGGCCGICTAGMVPRFLPVSISPLFCIKHHSVLRPARAYIILASLS